MEKEVKRGYVKWVDEDGVFHKEPLVDHPQLLKNASPREQLAAEEAKRMNAAVETVEEDSEEAQDELFLDTLADLKAAPADVLTASQLEVTEETKPASAVEEPAMKTPLEELRLATS